jgi:3-oxoacyl-[acyl-carrier-protein] synthase-3
MNVLPPLRVLGIGLHLPATVSVRDHAAERGADVSDYRGWERACHAGDDEHPSTMGARALAQALGRSGVAPEDLRLVVYTGSSRDYVPSWSVATEIMRLGALSDRCIGLDLTAGCLATLAGLDLAHGWLAVHGGGCAAIVAAERWSQTIDVRDPTTATLWAYGDSAGALVVGVDATRTGVVDFLGAEFRSASGNNGHVMIPYGGTREPQAPPGVDPYTRRVSDRPKQELTASYRKGYGDALAALKARFGIEPVRMLCNQMSPQLVGMLTEVTGMDGRVVQTGDRMGHLGGTDVILGLDTLVSEIGVDGPVLVCASAAFGFATGLLVPVPEPGPER